MSNRHIRRCSASLATRKCKSEPHGMPLYHFIPKKKGKITSAGENMENVRKLEPRMPLVGMLNEHSCCGDSLAGPLKVKQNDSVTPGVSSREWKQGWNRYLHTCVHSSIAHSHQKVETTQVPIHDGWMHKVWSLHTMDHSSVLRKEILTGYNMDKRWGHHAQWRNLATEGQTLSDAIHRRFLEESDSQRQEVRQWVPGAGRGAGELVFDGDSASLGRWTSSRDRWWGR